MFLFYNNYWIDTEEKNIIYIFERILYIYVVFVRLVDRYAAPRRRSVARNLEIQLHA